MKEFTLTKEQLELFNTPPEFTEKQVKEFIIQAQEQMRKSIKQSRKDFLNDLDKEK